MDGDTFENYDVEKNVLMELDELRKKLGERERTLTGFMMSWEEFLFSKNMSYLLSCEAFQEDLRTELYERIGVVVCSDYN
jgi:hypothetical protein